MTKTHLRLLCAPAFLIGIGSSALAGMPLAPPKPSPTPVATPAPQPSPTPVATAAPAPSPSPAPAPTPGTGQGEKPKSEALQTRALAKLHSINLLEVELARQVVERAENPAVRIFAQQMIDSHSSADTLLTNLAEKNGLSVIEFEPRTQRENRDHQAELEILAMLPKLSGAELDKYYITKQLTLHMKAYNAARKLKTDVTAADLIAFYDSQISEISHHYMEAKRIRSELK